MKKSLAMLMSAVREAGNAISSMRQSGVAVLHKANKDLVTEADLRANQILQARILGAYPNDGWLSEESYDNQARLRARRIWVVDPIDGTEEYVAGVPEYAVSVALVEEGVVTLACVFNPETDELFTAERGCGSFLNGQRIVCNQLSAERLVLLASRTECRRGEWERFSSEDVRPMGSIAYKLAMVAAGAGDATFSLGPKSEWDVAAGVLIVNEASGMVTDKNCSEIVFNQPDVLVQGVVAASRHAMPRVMALIRE